MTQLTLVPEYENPEPFVGQIYFMTDGVRVKVGYTERPPKRRGGELKTEVIYVMPGDEVAERREHKRWSASRVGMSREWFEATRTMLVWLALRTDPAANPHAASALEWLAGNLDRRCAAALGGLAPLFAIIALPVALSLFQQFSLDSRDEAADLVRRQAQG